MTKDKGHISRADDEADLTSILLGKESAPVKTYGMYKRPVVLWINLTDAKHDPVLPSWAEDHCSIHFIQDTIHIGAMIDTLAPNTLCFEFDCPCDAGLAAITLTKREHPRIPIFMLTKSRSEALAVWALRARVWDYRFSAQDVLRSMISLFKASRAQSRSSRSRQVIFPQHDFTYMRNLKGSEKTILKAQSYILKNLSRAIQLRDVAQHCCVSPAHLSRIFSELSCTTFKNFVLQTRIRWAKEKLVDSNATVTSVCYDVGFRDVSHFGRVFRRFMGVTPSQYRIAVLDGKRTASQSGHSGSADQTPSKRPYCAFN